MPNPMFYLLLGTGPPGGGGGGGVPNLSDIIVIGDAEVEATSSHVIPAGAIATGVADAHGRVYDQAAAQINFTLPGGQERFISTGIRFRVRTDLDGALAIYRRTSGLATHIAASRLAGGQHQVSFGSGAASHDGAAGLMDLDTWYYNTLFADINDSGEYISKIFDADGVLLETLSGNAADTHNEGNLAELVIWGSPTSNTFTDEHWVDINGVFRGCGRVNARVPNGVGASSDWSRGGTDTGNNWDQVNVMPTLSAGNPSHVFATAVDQIDLYEFEDRSITGTPISVRQIMYGRARSAGTRQFKAMCRIGGVNFEGSQTFTSTSTTNQVPMIEDWKNNPATGNAWTDSEINAAQWGYKSVTDEILVINTSIHVLVDIAV